MDAQDIDFIDISTGIAAICFVAANIAITPLFAIPAFGAWAIVRGVRHSVSFQNWADRVSTGNRIVDKALDVTVPLLLPAPKNTGDTDAVMSFEEPQSKRKASTGATERLSWADRVTQVQKPDNEFKTRKLQAVAPTKQLTPEKEVKRTTADNMAEVLAKMPKRITYQNPQIPEPPTPTSVLVGYDPLAKNWVWADFGINGDTVHVFIAGMTRSGKDTEIRYWFTQLTSNNSPDDIQFVIIDAKGEWTTPSLVDGRHMAVPPVGGFELKIEKEQGKRRKLIDLANERIEDALIDTVELLQSRQAEFQRVGATNLQSYRRKTGKKLPLLMVIVTDVGTNFNGILEELVKFLVFKGGSLGVRAIISMQTASGEDTGWRGQMGMAMSGYQAQSSADAPNIGIPVRAMKYRPSELPETSDPMNRGLFVVRQGIYQRVVRGVYLPDEVFEDYVENHLPAKSIMIGTGNKQNDEFLGKMLLDYTTVAKEPEPPKQIAIQAPKRVLSEAQVKEAVKMLRDGIAPSNVTKALGFTSAERYAAAMPLVLALQKAFAKDKVR
jgi:hypothetical protein